MSTASLNPSVRFLFLSTLLQWFSSVFGARQPVQSSRLTRLDEAEALRKIASELPASEAAYAQDLFAAADRHEWN